MKTIFTKSADVERKWHVIDANGHVVGRLATQVANILRGKNKPIFTPNSDTGDFVVIINAEKVRFTGNKLDNKKYYRHTGYPGGIKEVVAKDLLEKTPERVLFAAIKGMLPKNRLGRQQISKLKIYGGPDHPHKAQNPELLTINTQ